MTYNPNPIDTSNVKLTSEILELTEILAKNVHEIWAENRMKEGWVYGPRRNDSKKENPCIVPYKDLPESEKEYDRKAAMQTIKTIVALGFNIEKSEKYEC